MSTFLTAAAQGRARVRSTLGGAGRAAMGRSAIGRLAMERSAMGRSARKTGTTKLVAATFLLAALAIVLAAGFSPVDAQSGQFAIVFATGGLGDQSFNDSAFAGVQAAEGRFGVQFAWAEPTAVAEYEALLTRFAQRGNYDLIISIGFDQADAVTAVAARFPNQRFAIIDAVAEGDNVVSYVYREAERGFLLGAIAGLMTQRADDPKINDADVIGVVGGMDIPLINANIAGYIAGAKYVNPDADVRFSYVGDWADPARGKELALAQFDQGVDIIWGAAGLSGLGVIQAAEEADRYVMGADDDQGHLAPEHVLTNGMKYVNNTVLLAVESVLNGDFTPGIVALGVSEGALGFSDSLVPVEIRAAVGRLAAQIVSGDIVPPETIAEVEAWLAANH